MSCNLTWQAMLIASFVFVVGCGSPTPTQDQGANDETLNAQAVTAAENSAGDVKLDILSFDEIQDRIASMRGKIVVLDAWSTSCPPCMKDFHNLVEIHRQQHANGVACISLSFDYEGLGSPEDASEPVLSFLREQGATFDNLMSNEESDVLYRKFELNAVPAVFVYDRDGKLRERFESEGAYEKVRQLLSQLTAESADATSGESNPAE